MTTSNAGLFGPDAILTSSGVPVTNQPVTVYESNGTTTAPLYTDNTMVTPASNPVSTDSYGNLAFYAAPGVYILSFTVSGVATTKMVVVQPWYTDSLIRSGQIIDTAEAALAGGGAVIDGAWFLCDGSAVSRTTYSTLYTALGAASSPWGQGDGSTTFNVPDLRGRTTIMAGNVGSNSQPTSTIGNVGGEELHDLVVGEIPSHTHNVTVSTTTGGESVTHGHITDGNGNSATPAVYAIGSGGSAIQGYTGSGTAVQMFWASGELTAQNSADHNHSFTVTPTTDAGTGGNGAHNNMQPFGTVQKLIKF